MSTVTQANSNAGAVILSSDILKFNGEFESTILFPQKSMMTYIHANVNMWPFWNSDGHYFDFEKLTEKFVYFSQLSHGIHILFPVKKKLKRVRSDHFLSGVVKISNVKDLLTLLKASAAAIPGAENSVSSHSRTNVINENSKLS